MTDTLLTVLKMARGRIDTPEKWAKGAFALDAEGNAINPRYEGAVCLCAEGAIRWALWEFKQEEPNEYGEHNLTGHDAYEIKRLAYNAVWKAAHEAGVPGVDAPSEDFDYPSNFNDLDTTTHEHVLAAFDGAIAAVESQL